MKLDPEMFNINHLREYREGKGITQSFIARKLGFKNPTGYALIENGQRKLSFIMALQIAQVLDEDLETLFFDK